MSTSDTIHLKWTSLDTLCRTTEIARMAVYPWSVLLMRDPNCCHACLAVYRLGLTCQQEALGTEPPPAKGVK